MTIMMKKLLIALFCAAILFAPALAEARAGYSGGGYGSMGSRGSQTYSSNGVQPLQRSMTPQSGPYSADGGGGGYGYGGGGYGYGGHPFISGLAGGFLGGWFGSMLFPHYGGYGYGGGYGGGGGGFGIIGTLIIWLLIIWGISRLFRMFWHRGSMFASGGNVGMGGPEVYPAGGGYYGATAAQVTAPLSLTPSDQAAFEGVLKAVQGAWGKGDLQTLRHYVTPEMLSYFSEQLAQNQSRGVENHVEQVELIQGDLREAWDEGGMQYGTALLHWRAIDYTMRVGRQPSDSDYIVDGNPNQLTEAQEVWTFARVAGGHWLLSAIQQV